MTRDAPDVDAALAPLAAERAPVGFARRTKSRFEAALAARRQRRGLAIAAVAVTLLVVVSGSFVALAAPHVDFVSRLSTALAALFAATFHLVLHALADDPARLVALVAELAAVFAAASVALAALVRRESRQPLQ